MSQIKSMFVIQATATNVPGVNGNLSTKYLSYDQSSGGYPWFPESWNSANFFESYEKAKDAMHYIRNEKPSVYGSGAFSQHAIPHTLRSVVGGRVDNDGKYRFVFHIIEVKGNTLLTSEIISRYQMIVEAEQFHNVPNKPPVLTFHEKEMRTEQN